MPLKINSNYFYSKIFFDQLSHLNVNTAVISPGSRNTPLVLALANNNKFNKYIIVDERSAAFFALGLAKKSKLPVVLVCTSGTAAVEYYPAIVEAFQTNTPLIICTADRPAFLFNSGANQTINQRNLYKNHILEFVDYTKGLPNTKNVIEAKRISLSAYEKSNVYTKGPVHINFQFYKPLEPESFTDEIDFETLKESEKFYNSFELKLMEDKRFITNIVKLINKTEKGLITVGPLNESEEFIKIIIKFSELSGYPILADSTSNLRFNNLKADNIFSNPDSILRSDVLRKKILPQVIFHFGLFNTSVCYEYLLKDFKGKRFVINEYGRKADPVNLNSTAIQLNFNDFNELILKRLIQKNIKQEIFKADKEIEKIKQNFINKIDFNSPPKFVNKILSLLPENSNLFLSNSLPVRDFDFFASKIEKKIRVFSNRGASGIDGIISTALGIASNGEKTVLVTGDLAFFYDINALHVAIQNKIPLIIILINNNGGGIFNLLPISQNENFEKYFQTPLNINFKKIVKAFGGKYFSAKNEDEFAMYFNDSLYSDTFNVIEIKLNEKNTLKDRKKFWNEIRNKYFLTNNDKR